MPDPNPLPKSFGVRFNTSSSDKGFKSESLLSKMKNLALKIVAYGVPAFLMVLGFVVIAENQISDSLSKALDMGYVLLIIGIALYGIEYAIGRGQGYNIGRHV